MRPTRITKYEEVEIDFDIDDVIEFIEKCNDKEAAQIKETLNLPPSDFGESLYDREKFLIIRNLFNKYTLEQLKAIENEALINAI